MKKIFTLSALVFSTLVSFADYGGSRITVTAKVNEDYKIAMDDSRFGRQVLNNDAVFENVQPGFHTVSVYKKDEHRFGLFGLGRRDEFCLLYTTYVMVKPHVELCIVVNNWGKGSIDEHPLFDRDGDRDHVYCDKEDHHDWDYNKHNDDNGYGRGNNKGYNGRDEWNNNDDGNGNNSVYSRNMTNEEFYAAKRMVQRENFDENKLIVAKHVVDVSDMTAAQVKEIAILFSFDSAKLDFVKYAFRNTIDRNNYFMIYDIFSFSSSKGELAQYIRSFR